MTKTDLAEMIAKEEELSKAAAHRVVNLFLQSIVNAVAKGDSVTLTGFGTFQARTRRAAQRINPRTKQRIMVPAKVVPRFKAGKEFKQRVSSSMRP